VPQLAEAATKLADPTLGCTLIVVVIDESRDVVRFAEHRQEVA
jgi:hypothetical protein